MRLQEGVGALVLAAILAGGAWVRTRGSAPESGLEPDITRVDQAVEVNGLRVSVSLSPRPPVALSRVRTRVRIEANGGTRPIQNGRVSYAMSMPMGDHAAPLVADGDGWSQAEIVLPACLEGGRWLATVTGTVDGQPVTAAFHFELAQVAAAP
jgi:hypothetical protein